MTGIFQGYTDYYARSTGNVYPTEWLIRTFKGKYPQLAFDAQSLKGCNFLELGFGEGRNMSLFDELGYRLHGIEVSQKICEIAIAKLQKNGIKADLREGFNHAIPFDDASFDCAVSCHSFYYVSRGTTFKDNVAEAVRVLKPGGWFVLDLVDSDCYLFEGATHLEDGLYECARDPFGGIRDGALFQAFDDIRTIERTFSPFFEMFSFGYQMNNFYGSKQTHHLVVCRKRS